MSAVASVENLLAWMIQVSVIALVGVLLPMLFHIRHPKSQLTYYHLVLLLCFVLPLIQPWQHSLLFVSPTVNASAATTAPQDFWPTLIVTIALCGIAAKLGWLAVGLWQLRRYRRSATPLNPIPEAIREARRQVVADAVFCVSQDVTGPATVGHIDPVVLLPASFLSLDEDAQRSIACHELLHVRRKDWLVALLEEIAGALFWFNPAVRWLLGQMKLTREQVVDAEVVRVTAPVPYIQALLSMAVVTQRGGGLPAASFFTHGHLVHRMRSLLANPSRSWIRLSISYATLACLLAGAGWSLVAWFPLYGEAEVVASPGHRSPILFLAKANEDNVVFFSTGGEFNVRVPAPRVRTGVVRGLRISPTDISGRESVEPLSFIPPPPLPPPPPPPEGMRPPGFGLIRVSHLIRPGQKPSVEELERFIHSFPDPTFVEVKQAEDGTVERITVQARRLRDAANSIPFSDAPHLAGQAPAGTTNAAEPAGATDRVH